MKRKISFERCLEHMTQCSWNLDDVFRDGSQLDFSKQFIPSTLTLHRNIETFLNENQCLALNHITAKGYLNFFHFVEEFIIHKTKQISEKNKGNASEHQAFRNFFKEEIKHQRLFRRVMASIDKGLIKPPKVVNFEKKTADEILKNTTLGTLLFMLHLEVITQEHYIRAVKDDKSISQAIVRVLQYHWIEESQHANIDYLELGKIVKKIPESEKIFGMNEYMACLDKLHDIFSIQAGYDLESLNALHKLDLSSEQQSRIAQAQKDTYVMLFITSGLEHQQLSSSIEELLPNLMYVFEEYKKSAANRFD